MKYFLVIVCSIFWLTGCYDKFYGPKLKNNLQDSIDISIEFVNGDIARIYDWEHCKSSFVGRGSREIDTIKEIIIYQNSIIIKRLNAEKVNYMIKMENEYNRYSVWSIDAYGNVNFTTGSSAKNCIKNIRNDSIPDVSEE